MSRLTNERGELVHTNQAEADLRWHGEVIELQSERGFGFIRDENGQSRFFHAQAVEAGWAFEEFAVGDRVSFEPADSNKGPRALQVRKET